MTHRISPEAKQIINDYWPQQPKDFQSLGIYRDMQSALLQLHFPKMDTPTKARALKTYERLQKNRNRPLI